MGLVLGILLFVFVFATYSLLPFVGYSSIIRGKVQHDEWTKFDENGIPVCGVGYRGYWTNTGTFGGKTPFRQRKDGTWYNPETGQDCVVLKFSEMLELVEENKNKEKK